MNNTILFTETQDSEYLTSAEVRIAVKSLAGSKVSIVLEGDINDQFRIEAIKVADTDASMSYKGTWQYISPRTAPAFSIESPTQGKVSFTLGKNPEDSNLHRILDGIWSGEGALQYFESEDYIRFTLDLETDH